MGARVYVPVLGRFLSVDPVEGGVENSYVYPPDAVNEEDLSGMCPMYVPLVIAGLRVAAPIIARAAGNAGVYIAKTTSKKIYVGQTNNFSRRAYEHSRTQKIPRYTPRIQIPIKNQRARDGAERLVYNLLGGKRAPWLENKIRPPKRSNR